MLNAVFVKRNCNVILVLCYNNLRLRPYNHFFEECVPRVSVYIEVFINGYIMVE